MARLDSLPAGALFRWAGVSFSAQDRFTDDLAYRGVVYEQDLPARRPHGQTRKGTLGLMPIGEEVEPL